MNVMQACHKLCWPHFILKSLLKVLFLQIIEGWLTDRNSRFLKFPITCIHVKCDRILENLPFGHKQIFPKTQLKIYTMVLKLISSAHLDNATIKPSSYEISYQKLPKVSYYLYTC